MTILENRVGCGRSPGKEPSSTCRPWSAAGGGVAVSGVEGAKRPGDRDPVLPRPLCLLPDRRTATFPTAVSTGVPASLRDQW
jgi:hypothetical protein